MPVLAVLEKVGRTFEDIHLLEFKNLELLASQAAVTVDESSLCSCIPCGQTTVNRSELIL